MVECQLPKLKVAGSSPVARSIFALVASLAPLIFLNNCHGLRPDTDGRVTLPEGPLSEARLVEDDLNIWFGAIAFSTLWAELPYADNAIPNLTLRVTYGFEEDDVFSPTYSPFPASLGPRFRHLFERYIRRDNDDFVALGPFAIVRFRKAKSTTDSNTSNVWQAFDQGISDELVERPDGSLEMRDGFGGTMRFEPLPSDEKRQFFRAVEQRYANRETVAFRYRGNELTAVEAPFGRTFVFDWQGPPERRRIARIAAPAGIRITFDYDDRARLTAIRRGTRAEVYGWSEIAGRFYLRTRDDGGLNLKTYRYCGIDRDPDRLLCPNGFATGVDMPFTSITSRRIREKSLMPDAPLAIRVRRSGEKSRLYRFDADGLRTEAVYDGGTFRISWNKLYRKTAVETLPNGAVAQMTYDTRGRIIARERRVRDGVIRESWAYTAPFDRPTEYIESGVRVFSRIYNDFGLVLREESGRSTIENEYSDRGSLMATRRDGETIYLVEATDNAGNITRSLRDGNITSYAFDPAGRIIEASREELLSRYDYDDANDLPRAVAYVGNGRIIAYQPSIYFPDGTLAVRIEPEGMRVSIPDAEGPQTLLPLREDMLRELQSGDGFALQTVRTMLVLAAGAYKRAEEHAKALAAARLLSQLDPANPIGHMLAASLLPENAPLALARGHLLQAVKINGDNYRTLYDAALALLRRGDRDGAAPLFTRALKLNPDSMLAPLGIAYAATRLKGADVAPLVEPFIARYPNNLVALDAAACIYARAGDDAASQRYARRIEEERMKHKPDIRFVILRYEATCKPEVELLAQSEDPDGDAGDEAMRAGDTAKALRAYRDALERFPRFYLAHLRIARAFLAAGHAEAGLTALETTVSLNPAAAEAWALMARVRSQEGDRKGAWLALETGAAEAGLHDALFLEAMRLGDHDADAAHARDWVDRRIARDGLTGELAVAKQSYDDRLGQRDQCIAAGLTLLRDPAPATTPSLVATLRNNTAWCMRDEPKRVDEALAILAPALDRYPDRPAFLHTAATLLRLAGRLDEARKTAERCLALHPDETDCAELAAELRSETRL